MGLQGRGLPSPALLEGLSPVPTLCSWPSSDTHKPTVGTGVLGLGGQVQRALEAWATLEDRPSRPPPSGSCSSCPLPSLEEDFITWREQFWPAVCEFFGVEATGEESR